MKKLKQKARRGLVLLITFAMCLSVMPTSFAQAPETVQPETAATETQQPDPTVLPEETTTPLETTATPPETTTTSPETTATPPETTATPPPEITEKTGDSSDDEADGTKEAVPECSCTEKCAEETVNGECPVCGAEGADLTVCAGKAEETEEPEEAPPVQDTVVLGDIKVRVQCVNNDGYTAPGRSHVGEGYGDSDLQNGTYTILGDAEAGYRLALQTERYVGAEGQSMPADPGTVFFRFNTFAGDNHIALDDTVTVALQQNGDGRYGVADGLITIDALCLPDIQDHVTFTVYCDSEGSDHSQKHSLVLGNQYNLVQAFGNFAGESAENEISAYRCIQRDDAGNISCTLTLSPIRLENIATNFYNGLTTIPDGSFTYLDRYGKHTLAAEQPGPLSVTFHWNAQERKWVVDENANRLDVHVACGYQAPLDADDLYVANTGSDDTGNGTAEKPFATLAHAVDVARDGATIHVLTDLTMNGSVRCLGKAKNLTIRGEGATAPVVSRGNIPAVQDPARSTYNPAMIEVDGTFRFENIIFDDGGQTAGARYAQASTNGAGGNGDTVQDAIIACYDGGDAIILGGGAQLRNFGGMSAVRISGGTLTMESGSSIVGSKAFTTTGGGTGAAGAVWLQGGAFLMSSGAEIRDLSGRAVYVDGGSATVNGAIRKITANGNLWQGQSGAAIHVRNKGFAVLGETGVIDGVQGSGGASYTGAVTTNGSRGEGLWDFEAKAGSVIQNVTGFPTLYSNYGAELLNGTITNCSSDFIIGGFAQKTTVGETGVIEHCTAKGGAANAIVYTSNASRVFLRGAVRNNTASHAFYIINQSGGGASLEMYEGALISGTTGEGVYVNASECSFVMHGGTITENGSYGVRVREKAGRAAWFTMEGGSITNNGSYGVYHDTNSGKTGYVNIIGGEISGNRNAQVYLSGFNAEDAMSRVQIAQGVVKAANGKNAAVQTSFATLTLDANYVQISLGNAKSAASNKIKELVQSYESGGYTVVGSALWLRPTARALHFTASRSSSVNPNNYLKVGYLPLNADGTPADGAALTVLDVANTGAVDVTLAGLTAGQPYALMWVVPDENATGMLKLTADTGSVAEVEGKTDPYTVDYTLTYQAKDLSSSVQVGDTFTATAMLDPNLVYVEGSAALQKPIFGSACFEQVGDAVYNAQTHTVTVQLRVLKKISSSTSLNVKLSASFAPGIFDSGVKELATYAGLTGTLLSGKTVDLQTRLPCITTLIPLARYTVTFDANGGSLAEGTDASVHVRENESVEEPADPTREGYTFGGWRIPGATGNYDFTAPVIADITLVAQWTQTPAVPPTEPTNPETPDPTTPETSEPPVPETPAPTPVAPAAPAAPVAPAVPAPAAPAPAAPEEELEEPETPLAPPEEPVNEPEAPAAPEEELVESSTPLASGRAWSLANLLLMALSIVGALVVAAGMLKNGKSLVRLAGMLPAVGSVALFCFTQDLTAPMAFADRWTLWMALIAIAQAAVLFGVNKASSRRQAR